MINVSDRIQEHAMRDAILGRRDHGYEWYAADIRVRPCWAGIVDRTEEQVLDRLMDMHRLISMEVVSDG